VATVSPSQSKSVRAHVASGNARTAANRERRAHEEPRAAFLSPRNSTIAAVTSVPLHLDLAVVAAAAGAWVVDAKRPFSGPEQVLEYLGRYTHRVAITNNRIKSVENGKVTFTYKDRNDNDRVKEKTLPAMEFIRRFLLHVLPKGFMKIRYFGFLSHRNKGKYIPLIRRLINRPVKVAKKLKETVKEMMLRLTGIDISRCPECKKGTMTTIRELPRPVWDTS